MTPKELRKQAEIIAEFAHHDSDVMSPDVVVVLARHYLATVREDDEEPVTMERLRLLGGVTFTTREWCVSWQGIEFAFEDDGKLTEVKLAIEGYSNSQHVAGRFLPRNMKEARLILERCGAIEEKK